MAVSKCFHFHDSTIIDIYHVTNQRMQNKLHLINCLRTMLSVFSIFNALSCLSYPVTQPAGWVLLNLFMQNSQLFTQQIWIMV